jgi:hypothetical protein
MAVTSISRWNGGSRADVVAFAKKLKPIFRKVEGEYQADQIYSGPHAGQWLISIRYRDWETYGKAMQALTNDTAYLEVLADVGAISQLTDRTLVVAVDLLA